MALFKSDTNSAALSKFLDGSHDALLESEAPMETVRTIRVPAEHETLQGAIEAAKPHERIVLEPGRYSGAVAVVRPVVIEAAVAGSVTLTANAMEILRVRVNGVQSGTCGSVVIRGVNFDGVSDFPPRALAVVAGGVLELEGCCFIGGSESQIEALAVGAHAAHLIVRHCRWMGAGTASGAGVVAAGGGVRVNFDDCHFEGHGSYAVAASAGAAVELCRCVVTRSGAAGVNVTGGDGGRDEDECRPLISSRPGAEASNDVPPTSASLDDCDLHENANGVLISGPAASVTVRGGAVRKNHGYGLAFLRTGAAGSVRRCDLRANKGVALIIGGGSRRGDVETSCNMGEDVEVLHDD